MKRRLRCVPIAAIGVAMVVLSGCTPGLIQQKWTDYGNNNDRLDDWTGGDGTFSVELPDGRIAWLFSDTYLGYVAEDGTRPSAPPMVNNSLVIQAENGGDLVATKAGTNSRGFLGDPGYWIMDGTVEGDTLWIFARALGNSDRVLAEVSLPDLEPTGHFHVVPSAHPDVNGTIGWGASILEEQDHTYVYGHAQPTANLFINVMYLARTAAGDITGDWEYWTGAGWSSDMLDAVPVADDAGEAVPVSGSVVKQDDHYVLVGKQNQWWAEDMRGYSSPSPTGPFTGPVLQYDIPEQGEPCGEGAMFAYRIVAHPEFTMSEEGTTLFSYNVHCRDAGNGYDPEWNWGDASLYRARFVALALP
jgi:hypothetical protein